MDVNAAHSLTKGLQGLLCVLFHFFSAFAAHGALSLCHSKLVKIQMH